MPNQKTSFKGLSVIEAMVAIAIVALAFSALWGVNSLSLKVLTEKERQTKAVFLAQDLLEIAKNVRDGDWTDISSLTMGANYYPVRMGTAPDWYWQLQPGTETVGPYTRKLVSHNASRDAADNIEPVYNPLNDDPDTRKIIAMVSWQEATGPRQIELTTYIANWR